MIPRYVRIYDNKGKTFDRYTVVYTKKRISGQFMYVGMSENPFEPQGYGQHGSSDQLIDRPKYSHLGKKITFEELPEKCKELVVSDYKEIWS